MKITKKDTSRTRTRAKMFKTFKDQNTQKAREHKKREIELTNSKFKTEKRTYRV